MIEARQVTYEYRAGARTAPALSGVDISVEPGRLVVVCGRNGSGKSTLARLLNGLALPRSGSVSVDGMFTSDSEHAWEIRRRVGLVQQNPDNQIVGALVEEDVAFGPENLGVPRAEMRERVSEALATVGLTGLERREPHSLSGGQKQRLAIAGALAMLPDYLVLDEPTAMLDPEGRADVLTTLTALRERGVGIMHITHHLEDAAAADAVVVLDEGRVAYAGSPQELLGRPDLIAEMGLTTPPMGTLVHALRDAGLSIDAAAWAPDSVVEALWPSS